MSYQQEIFKIKTSIFTTYSILQPNIFPARVLNFIKTSDNEILMQEVKTEQL